MKSRKVLRHFVPVSLIAATTCIATPLLADSAKSVEGIQHSPPPVIHFEKTDYGLIFTNLQANGVTTKAMIDFGDQHVLQLSSSLVKELEIEIEEAGYQIGDVNGNTWEVNKGIIETLAVGSSKLNHVEFTTQEGEMESVSEQIGTRFDAVLGWGFFKPYFTEVDYSEGTFTLLNKISPDSAVFSVPFIQEANQLIITAQVDGKPVNMMIDTGSPVTVVDTAFRIISEGSPFDFQLADQNIHLMAYQHDLSVLADLKIVAILGGDFLQQWKVVIDPKKNTLHFYQ